MLTKERLSELKKYAQGGDEVTFPGLARALAEVLGHVEFVQEVANGLEAKVDRLNVQAAKDRYRAEAAERRVAELEGRLIHHNACRRCKAELSDSEVEREQEFCVPCNNRADIDEWPGSGGGHP